MRQSFNVMKRVLLLVCGLILWSGCASPTARITRHRDFDAAQLTVGGLILAGVTALGGGEYVVADTTSQRFAEALREETPGLKFVGLSGARKLLGDTELQSFEKQFSEEGRLPRALLTALQATPDAPGYIAWINLTRSTSDGDVLHRRDVTYRVITDPTTGRSIVVEDHVYYVTTSRASRYVAAEFLIYEKTTGKQIWSAQIDHADRNAFMRRSAFYYPAATVVQPPGTFEVLEPIIIRAARLLFE